MNQVKNQGLDPFSSGFIGGLLNGSSGKDDADTVYRLISGGDEDKDDSDGFTKDFSQGYADVESTEHDHSDAAGISGSVAVDPPSNNIVLAGGYGAAIIQAFISMMQYLAEQAQQNLQTATDLAQIMIGTTGPDGKQTPGMISQWVSSGCQAAKASGDQLKWQAIGMVIGAGFAALTIAAAGVGFVRNCTGFGSERAAANEQMAGAESYRTMLDRPSNATEEAAFGEENSTPLQPMGGSKPQIDTDVQTRMDQLRDGEGISSYRGGQLERTPAQAQNDEQTEDAAQMLSPSDRIKAQAAADKRVESAQARQGTFDAKQSNWMQFINTLNQGGGSAGQAIGGVKASGYATASGQEKAQSDAIQQASQTTEGTKEKSTSNLQSNKEQMAQQAQALAGALQAMVQDRA